MTRLHVRLFGPFEASIDDEPASGFDSDKVRALLAYLVVEADRPHRREKLVGLLWPDFPERSARTNLRRALSNLRQVIGDRSADPPYLLITRQTIQFNTASDAWVDVVRFAALHQGQESQSPALTDLEAATDLPRGPFMEGFSLPDSPPFEEWQRLTGEMFQQQFLNTLQHLSSHFESMGQYEQALRYARWEVEIDPYREDAHRRLMQALASSGQRVQALAQYETLKELLAAELGVEPERETTNLFTQIEGGEYETEAKGVSLPSGTVTFLFTDIQGSTELLKQLREQYAELLADQRRIMRTAFAEWDGREVDTQGDAFFVSFPRATQAVNAAVDIQQSLAEFTWPEEVEVKVRMGLHTGEPWVAEEGYVGIDVHRAARIAHCGHGGQILLSDTTTSLVRCDLPEGVTLLDLGCYQLKDIERPEPIHQLMIEQLPADFSPLKARLVQPHAATAKGERALPAFMAKDAVDYQGEPPVFVAREPELAQLDKFLEKALTGQGQVVFISGDPGCGKTALMAAFSRQAMSAHLDLLVASGVCDAYTGVGDPYLPFRDVMRMLTGDIESGWSAGEIITDHARRIWSALPTIAGALVEEAPALLDVFIQAKPLLDRTETAVDIARWLVPLREIAAESSTMRGDLNQQNLFDQYEQTLRYVAAEHPLLIILDDLQWADNASLNLLFHLGRRLHNTRILILGAYRPEEVELGRENQRHPLKKVLAEFKRYYGDLIIDLGATDVKKAKMFVESIINNQPNRLPVSFRTTLLAHTGGHPLFTIELLRDLQERGDLVTDEDGYWVEGSSLDWEVLPARVEAVIEERIDRLDPELQEILSIASVEGEVFTAQVAAKVLKLTERSVLRQLSGELEKRHRLVREQEGVQTSQGRISRYRFGHVLFQEYIYKRLSPGERRLLHEDVAMALEELYADQLDEMVVYLAYHFNQAGDEHQAFHYYSLAAERAANIYAHGEAITHYTSAIQLAERVSPNSVSLANLYRGRGLAYEMLGAFEQAYNDHSTSLRIAQDAGEYQIAWRALIDIGKLWASRDYDKTRDYFEAALDQARHMDDPASLAVSLNWMGNWFANNENPKMAIAYHREALRILEDLGERQELANTLDLLGIANLLINDLITSVHYYDQAIELFRELDDQPKLATSLIGRATTVSALVFQDSIPATPSPDAVSDFNEALRIAKEIGSAPDEAWVCWTYGLLHILHGHFGSALKLMKSGLNIASSIGHREWVVGNRNALGILYTELFALDQAREYLECALSLAHELRSPQWIHNVSGALAGTYLRLNDLKSAQACLAAVISPQMPIDTGAKRYCWVRQAELALAQDDPVEALDIIDCLIDSAPGMKPGRVITFLWKLKGEALAALGDYEEACPLLNAALKNGRVLNERVLLWQIHASIGRIHNAMHNQTKARTSFSAARELIENLAVTIPDEMLRKSFLRGAMDSFDFR